jgi:hypothetical protein
VGAQLQALFGDSNARSLAVCTGKLTYLESE